MTYVHADEIIAHVTTEGLTVEWLSSLMPSPTTCQPRPAFRRAWEERSALFDDADAYQVGQMQCLALNTPGHTSALPCAPRATGLWTCRN